MTNIKNKGLSQLKIQLSDGVKVIISKLNSYGFEAFAVGGCVRDCVIGLVPHDWDICTNAKPEQIKHCFKDFDTFDSGIKHGTISVIYKRSIYEITTYRIDGEYLDSRHPESVEFTNDITKDLARRDFTVNAMAYNEEKGLVDPFGGIQDVSRKIIKCVGDPDKRFDEDALRILRALRFASVYGFSIDKKTSDSVKNKSYLLRNIAYERIAAEFNKLLCGKNVEEILNGYKEVFSVFIPEFKPMFNFKQLNVHSNEDLWHQTTALVKLVEKDPLLRVAMLLHDIGKPESCPNGRCKYYNYPKLSAEIAERILLRLRYSKNFVDDCLKLIEYQDVRLYDSKKNLKRVMNIVGVDNTRRLIKIQQAINSLLYFKQDEKFMTAQRQLEEIINGDECFKLSHLAVNGKDIINLGIKEGKAVGEILDILVNKVIDEELPNTKIILLEAAKKLIF